MRLLRMAALLGALLAPLAVFGDQEITFAIPPGWVDVLTASGPALAEIPHAFVEGAKSGQFAALAADLAHPVGAFVTNMNASIAQRSLRFDGSEPADYAERVIATIRESLPNVRLRSKDVLTFGGVRC